MHQTYTHYSHFVIAIWMTRKELQRLDPFGHSKNPLNIHQSETSQANTSHITGVIFGIGTLCMTVDRGSVMSAMRSMILGRQSHCFGPLALRLPRICIQKQQKGNVTH